MITDERTWINLGDRNYFEYGGCLVRCHYTEKEMQKAPCLKNVYEVFSLNTEAGENGDELSALFCCVDLDNLTEEVQKNILFVNGLENEFGKPMFDIMRPEMWAKEMVECGTGLYQPTSYKSEYPSSWQDYILTEKELRNWLKNLDAKDFLPERKVFKVRLEHAVELFVEANSEEDAQEWINCHTPEEVKNMTENYIHEEYNESIICECMGDSVADVEI